MKLRALALTLITLTSRLAAADDAPPPTTDPAPYPAPPPQPYPAPQPYPQPYPPPQPQQYPPQYPPYGYVPMPAPMPEPPLDGPKSTGTGVLLSLAATFGPPLLASAIVGDNENNSDLGWGLLISSAVIGPSAGRIYAGDFFTVGLGVRAAAMAAILIGVNSDTSTDDEIGYIVLGSLALVGGGIADFAGIPGSVREYNFEAAKRTITPMVAPTRGPNGMTGAQVGLAGTF